MVMRVVTFKLEEEKLAELDILARAVGKRRSDLIREAIDMYIRHKKYIIENERMKRIVATIEKLRVY